MAKTIEPGRNGKPAGKAKEPKPETAADVLRRCLGLGNQQAAELAETLNDEERAELVRLAKDPEHGQGVRRVLDRAADRKRAAEAATRDKPKA